MTTLPSRLVAAGLVVSALAGCGGADFALQRVVTRSAAPVDRTFDLPEGFDIVDVRYASALVALDDDPDADDLRERSTVQVFAQHAETGEEVLFVYDLARDGAGPTSVIRFRRVPADPGADDPGAEPRPAPARRNW